MRSILAVGTVVVCTCLAAAAETPENLVKKLGSPSYDEREAAGAELLKLGAAALPAVKNAVETSPDPEIRERAQALLEPLSRASESSKMLSAKPFKFEAKTVSLTAAIAEFKQKTGIPLTLMANKVGNPNRMVTLPAGEYPPWEALEVLLKAADLREEHLAELPNKEPQPNPNQYRRMYEVEYSNGHQYTPATAPIFLVDGKAESLPASRGGGVRVTALPANFTANRVVRGAGRIIFHLDAAPVPATGWNGATGVKLYLAEDDEGRPVFADLKIQNENSNFSQYDGFGWNGRFGRRVFWGGGGGMMWIDDSYGGSAGQSPNANPRLVAVALRTNDRTITRLRKFEGVLLGDVHIPNVAVMTFDNLEKSVGAAQNGPQQSNLSVKEFKKNTNGTTTVKIRYEALSQWALAQMGGRGINNFVSYNDNPGEVFNRIKFYDAAGKVLKAPTQESTNYGGDGFRQTVDATLRFPKDSVPVKMVLTGTKISSVEVPFKLANVSVP